ncbi:MAG: nucleotidyltransferase domain-containing protein [Patescibacteria group bacterium]|nr:nucleotidyltransferase domain-containing protein [Patescibacteria group bacterium]
MIKQKYQRELNKLSKQIIEKYKPEKIILFGSLVSGEIREDSDIDLLIIKDTKKNYWQRAKDISRAIGNISIDVPKDIINITPKELKYRLSIGDYFVQDIINNGKMIYEKKQ